MSPDIEFKNAPSCIKEFTVDKDTGKITPVFTKHIHGDTSNLSNNSLRNGDGEVFIGSAFITTIPMFLIWAIVVETFAVSSGVVGASLLILMVIIPMLAVVAFVHYRSTQKSKEIESRISKDVKPHTVFSHFELWEVGDKLDIDCKKLGGYNVYYGGVYPNGDIAITLKKYSKYADNVYRINPTLLFELCTDDVNKDLNKRLQNRRINEMMPDKNNTYMSWLEYFKKSLNNQSDNNNENLISGYRRSAQFNELGNAQQPQPRNAPVAVES